MELKYHVTSEEPIRISNEHISVFAARHSVVEGSGPALVASNAQFMLPANLTAVVGHEDMTDIDTNAETLVKSKSSWWNGTVLQNSTDLLSEDSPLAVKDCFQSHMTSFQWNPYALLDKTQVRWGK